MTRNPSQHLEYIQQFAGTKAGKLLYSEVKA